MAFETSEDAASLDHRTLHIATLMGDLVGAAKEMVDDLPKWELVDTQEEPERVVLVCSRNGGLLAGTARITITLEAPAGVPATRVRVRSETNGALLARDKANVAEFVKPFNRRVC